MFCITSFDFDKEVQKHFNNSFSDIKTVNWEKWIDISTNEEYLELSLKLSGLSSIDDILERIQTEKTDSRQISLNLNSFLDSYNGSSAPILCHTSGTTNSEISALKWFHMAKNLVKRNWAPGMQAIFESSGLNTKNSAVIFVPSRIRTDGFQSNDGQDYISLYSSEFSQRVMLSIIKPHSYTFFEYKNSKNLDIISKILSLNKISVISAPAITILGWADLHKFQIGIKKSLETLSKEKSSLLDELLIIIEKEGIEQGSEIIQSKLSEKLSKSTIVFSISSLSEQNWSLIRKFMKWEKGKEKFTNLYVASEIGPFAASISKGDYEISRLNRMHVFPLTLPVLEYKNKISLISGISDQIGRLYVSRMGESSELINIDIGDIITIRKSEGLPQIDGNIIRSSFQLKYKIKLSDKIRKPKNYNILAGDFFSLNDFNIIQPRNLLNCLKYICKLESNALLLKQESNQFWELILPLNLDTNCTNEDVILKTISNCPTQKELSQAIVNKIVKIRFIEDEPIDFLATRDEVLKKVREGQVPKGILKKWPLYVIPTH
ncbi:MAG: hypothetical protein ACFE9S_02480 [Candidatus Hermodarchaeota archaeon]